MGAQDVWALWLEILDFIKKSIEVCETGPRPWMQAAFAAFIFGIGSALLAEAASRRPVAVPLVGSYWITRVLALRWLAGIYSIAFLVAYFQNKELIGDDGILPARCLLDRVDKAVEANLRGRKPVSGDKAVNFRRWLARIETLPSLLWLVRDRNNINPWLDGLSLAGFVLAAFALIRGGASAWHLLLLWALYHSLNSVGQRWYSFGWESQLLETGMLAVLAAPSGICGCACAGSALPVHAAVPVISPWAFRWMAFRIMLGAGLIKIRGASVGST